MRTRQSVQRVSACRCKKEPLFNTNTANVRVSRHTGDFERQRFQSQAKVPVTGPVTGLMACDWTYFVSGCKEWYTYDSYLRVVFCGALNVIFCGQINVKSCEKRFQAGSNEPTEDVVGIDAKNRASLEKPGSPS